MKIIIELHTDSESKSHLFYGDEKNVDIFRRNVKKLFRSGNTTGMKFVMTYLIYIDDCKFS